MINRILNFRHYLLATVKFQKFFTKFCELFSNTGGAKPVGYNKIDTGDSGPVFSNMYWYRKLPIIDYHLENILPPTREGIIIQIIICFFRGAFKNNNGWSAEDPEGWKLNRRS